MDPAGTFLSGILQATDLCAFVLKELITSVNQAGRVRNMCHCCLVFDSEIELSLEISQRK